MNSDQLYANGRIAVLSARLFGQDKFARLEECYSLAEALRVLAESGYGVTDNTSDYDAVLRAELDKTMAQLKQLCCDVNAVNYLLCEYTYVNAKVLMKSKYMRTDGLSCCYFDAIYPAEKMRDDFLGDNYGSYTKNMAEACDAVDTAFADGNKSPQTVDVILDKACFADMRYYARKSSNILMRKLFVWHADATNMMLVYRLKKASLPVDCLKEWFVEGGTIKLDDLRRAWNNEADLSPFGEDNARFFELCTEGCESLAAAERRKAQRRDELVGEYADMLTIQPAIAYFYRKTDEIQQVRNILVQVKRSQTT